MKYLKVVEEMCTVCKHPYKYEDDQGIWCPYCGHEQPSEKA